MSNTNRGKRSGSKSVWVVAGFSVVAVGVIIGASLYSARDQKPAANAVVSDADLGAVRNAKGSATAKVTVVEYNDYF